MKLRFQPNSEAYDPGRKVVTFEAVDGDKNILCEVSEEALRDRIDNTARTKDAIIKAFRSRRFSIEAAAALKYGRSLVGSDGRVSVQGLDLTRRLGGLR